MKKFLLIIAILIYHSYAYTQAYDLIVTTNGDSIACRIDSITNTRIYFEMKSNKYWKHTHIKKASVNEFQRNVINEKTFIFKSGSSIIEKSKLRPTSMFDIQKNSISIETTLYLALLLSYEIMFPLNNLSGINVRVGAGRGIDWEGGGYALGETTFLLGGPKNIVELGLSIYCLNMGSLEAFPFVRVGYRFQGYKGILIKSALYLNKWITMPSLSIGFSF